VPLGAKGGVRTLGPLPGMLKGRIGVEGSMLWFLDLLRLGRFLGFALKRKSNRGP